MGVQNDNIDNEGRTFEDAMRRIKPIVIGMTEEDFDKETLKNLSAEIDKYVGKNVSSDK